jgi:hypothetical protein
MKMNKHKLTLDRPVAYQIIVPGALDKKWLDWDGGMTATVESDKICTDRISMDDSNCKYFPHVMEFVSG